MDGAVRNGSSGAAAVLPESSWDTAVRWLLRVPGATTVYNQILGNESEVRDANTVSPESNPSERGQPHDDSRKSLPRLPIATASGGAATTVLSGAAPGNPVKRQELYREHSYQAGLGSSGDRQAAAAAAAAAAIVQAASARGVRSHNGRRSSRARSMRAPGDS